MATKELSVPEKHQLYTPKHLKRWTMPDSYFGAEWPEYYSSGFGRSRDSDDLEESNFVTALAALEAVAGETPDGESTVMPVRESHWAVGWVEWIAIHESDEKALRLADELRERMEGYPVLDEDDWTRREQEHAEDIWRDCYSDRERVRYIRENRSQFDFHDYADLIGCARGRYFAGYASDLLG